MFGLMKKRSHLIGVDLGNDCLKLAQLANGSEETVLLAATLSRDGGFQPIGKHPQDEGNELPLNQTALHVDRLNGGEDLLVESPAITTSEITDFHHPDRGLGVPPIVPQLAQVQRLGVLLLGGDSGSGGRGFLPADGRSDDGLNHAVRLGGSCIGFSPISVRNPNSP